MPMDVGGFRKDGGKGRGGGKKSEQRKCHNCGKPGHLVDCWAPGGGKASNNQKPGAGQPNAGKPPTEKTKQKEKVRKRKRQRENKERGQHGGAAFGADTTLDLVVRLVNESRDLRSRLAERAPKPGGCSPHGRS